MQPQSPSSSAMPFAPAAPATSADAASGTGTGTGTGTEDTRGTDTGTSQAEDTVDDGTASPASAPAPHATGAGDAPEAATAADGSSTDSADTADSSHTPDAGDTEGSEDAAGSGDTPDSEDTEDTEDTAATEGTTPSGSGTSGSSKGRNRSRKDKDRSARGQSRWSRFMKGRSPAPEGPAPEPASGPAPEAAPAVATRPDAQEDDTSLNTVFFMADNEAPLPGHEHDRNVQLPASLRSGHSQPPADSDLDPDTQATSALVDEANRIWRQHKPRHAENADDDQAHDHAARTTHDAPEGATSRSSSGSSSSGSSRESSRSRRSRDGSSRRSRRRSSSSHARESLGSLHDGYAHESAESTGWFTPKRRRIVMAVLGVLAAVQLVAVYRTEISYTVPFLRPVVQAISLITGQTIQPPMNLSALSIESFELRNTQKTGQTRMTAILRNRSGTATRWPAMELTLTGPSNAILVRKVLLPAQYLPAGHDQAAGMAPNSEQPLDLMLDTSDLNLAGYSVSLFYP